MSVCIILPEELRQIVNVMLGSLPQRAKARQVVELLSDLAAVSRANHRAFLATYPNVETLPPTTAASLVLGVSSEENAVAAQNALQALDYNLPLELLPEEQAAWDRVRAAAGKRIAVLLAAELTRMGIRRPKTAKRTTARVGAL